MQSVLVMGGSYFIGKKITEVLLDAGYDVSILNRGSKPIFDARIHLLIADRNSKEQMKQALEGQTFDYVVDVSGINQDQMAILNASLDLSQLKKFIFVSSSAVYDIDHLEPPYKESDKLAENSVWTFYGDNKIQAENYLAETLLSKKVDFVALRPPYMYGEDNYAQRESFLFDHIMNDQAIILPNEGASRVQFLHTYDLACIIVKLMQTDLPPDARFNVGNEVVSFKEWVQACSKIVGKEVKVIDFDYKSHNRKAREFFPLFDYTNVLDITEINKMYQPQITFEEGLRRAFEWYKANKETIEFKESVKRNEEEILSTLRG